MSTQQASHTRVVHTETFEGVNLYGGATHPYYFHPKDRQVVIEVTSTRHGFYATICAGRTLSTGQVTRDKVLGYSPVFASRDDLVTWLATAREFARTMRAQDPRADAPFPEGWADTAPLLCPQCGGLNTLSTAMGPYGNRTFCSECTYSGMFAMPGLTPCP